MSTGADPKSMPGTAEFRDGYQRTFGDRKPQRGTWIVDPLTGKLVPADEYQAPQVANALHAPVMVDRFMEGSVSQDGTDIGSRTKRKEYLRQTGAADSSDYSPRYIEQRRAAKDRATREATKRSVIEVSKLDTRHLPKFIEEGKKR